MVALARGTLGRSAEAEPTEEQDAAPQVAKSNRASRVAEDTILPATVVRSNSAKANEMLLKATKERPEDR